MTKKAIIAGAGPAGLTAAYELLQRTDIIPIILEKSGDIGGISKTINYKGNRMDIGGHRFFSKSDRVMKWWLNILPLDNTTGEEIALQYQNQRTLLKNASSTPAGETHRMLVRERLSRIFYLNRFFNYPLSLSKDTIRKLGFKKLVLIGSSYMAAKLRPRTETTLEDFFINRFGNNLYQTFFKDYTEKVWGVPCNALPADWGRQRVKELSVRKAVVHAMKKKPAADLKQKSTQTSLIERFLYPALGPGQLWEEVAARIVEMGGEIHFHHEVNGIAHSGGRISSIQSTDTNGTTHTWEGDYFFSTMPVQELIASMSPQPPTEIRSIAAGLPYRDFMMVGLLVKKLLMHDRFAKTSCDEIRDNWIYIQEKSVKLGRLQIFNNWSPYMVSDPDTAWLGLEYFCNVGDELWSMPDEAFITFATGELERIGFIDRNDVLDSNIVRMEKTYPAYLGTYNRFDEIRNYTDTIHNLFLVGRNGMHKYNNSDHSMLAAMTAVDNIIANITTKENIWEINTEQAYHEEE